jgi:hypothetical protein
MMVNVAMTLQPTTKYSALHHVRLFSMPLLRLFFSTIPLPPLVSICAHSLKKFKHIFYIHAFVNSKTSKMLTTFGNKQKQLSTITPFIFVLELLASFIHFFTYLPFLINVSSSKLIGPITITFCVPCIATWKHFTPSL